MRIKPVPFSLAPLTLYHLNISKKVKGRRHQTGLGRAGVGEEGLGTAC